MKFIGSVVANVSVGWAVEEIRPSMGFSPTDLATIIGDRYSFAQRSASIVPRLVDRPAPGGRANMTMLAPAGFSAGHRQISEQVVSVQSLELNLSQDPAGITVHSTTTESAGLILDDLVDVLSALGFRNLHRAKRHYSSNLVVEFDARIEDKIEQIGEIQRIIGGALGEGGDSLGFERMTFSTDVMSIAPSRGGHGQVFVLERRANVPFHQNRFFSLASLETASHLKVLEEIAALLSV